MSKSVEMLWTTSLLSASYHEGEKRCVTPARRAAIGGIFVESPLVLFHKDMWGFVDEYCKELE